MAKVSYFVSEPDSVKNVAKQFRKELKKRNHYFLPNFYIEKLQDVEECKFAFVFCPIVSRTGTDIDAKLNEIERDFKEKPVILIVLHHTFDPESIVSESKKFVKRQNIHTLDVLFHEDKGLLDCERNSNALKDAANKIHEIQHTKHSTTKKKNKKSKK